MAYMVEDFYRPNAVMDFPRGGARISISTYIMTISYIIAYLSSFNSI